LQGEAGSLADLAGWLKFPELQHCDFDINGAMIRLFEAELADLRPNARFPTGCGSFGSFTP
jgi:hypothetical protein